MIRHSPLSLPVNDSCPACQVRTGNDLLQAGEVHPGGGSLPQGAGHQPLQLRATVSYRRSKWPVWVATLGLITVQGKLKAVRKYSGNIFILAEARQILRLHHDEFCKNRCN